MRYLGLIAALVACGGGSDVMPTASETANGAAVCPLGWTQGLSAVAQGSNVVVQGSCGTTANFFLHFSPTPPSGGTAPLTYFCFDTECIKYDYLQCGFGYDQGGNGYLDPNRMQSGTVTVSGSSGSLRVDGNASCMAHADPAGNPPQMATVQFTMPLTVQ